MRLELTGRHVDITPALRRLVTAKLSKLERMLNHRAVSAQAVLSREKHSVRADITLHARGEKFLHGVGNADGWETSIGEAIAKISQQAERVKSKFTDRKRRGVRGTAAVAETGEAASVKPAAITANIVGQVPSGTTGAAFGADLKTLIAGMLSANLQVSSLVLIMSQQMALSLSLIRTSLGVKLYPDISMQGGYLEGIPVIASEAITSVGSPATGMIVAVNAKDVFLADDGMVSVDVSDQASLEMSDAPAQDGTTGGGASMVSLFQTNMIALRAEREINWKLMRAAS